MSDDEIVEFAQRVIERNGCQDRKTLKKLDSGLHEILRQRGLLGAVFASYESQKQREAVQEVVDAMAEFDSS